MEARAGYCCRGSVQNSRPRSNLGVTVFSLHKVCLAGAVAAGHPGRPIKRGTAVAGEPAALQLCEARASILPGLRVL